MAMFAKIGEKFFSVGDTVRVHYKLIEKEKEKGRAKREVKEKIRERIQIFEGIVIAIKGKGDGRTFTVRKIGTAAIGIERIFPLFSPWISKLTVKKKGNVRRAKLYYLRSKKGKEAQKLKGKEMKEEEVIKEHIQKKSEDEIKKDKKIEIEKKQNMKTADKDKEKEEVEEKPQQNKEDKKEEKSSESTSADGKK